MKRQKCHLDNPENIKYYQDCCNSLILEEEISISMTKTIETSRDDFSKGTLFADRDKYKIINQRAKLPSSSEYFS